MAKILFNPQKKHLNQKIIQARTGDKLMQTLLNAGLPVASSCKGDGVCGKCKIAILKGSSQLSEESSIESKIRNLNNYAPNERVSCQTQILGDIIVDTNYW